MPRAAPIVAVALIAGAVLAWTLAPRPPAPTPDPALERRVADLERRLARIEGAASVSPVRASPRSGPRDEAERLAAAQAVIDQAPEEHRPELERLVRDAVSAEREERFERRRQAMADRAEERLADFAASQALPEAQRVRLSELLASEREAIGDVMRTARDTMDWEGVRDEIARLRQETDAQARTLVGDEPFAAWTELRADDRPWGPPPRD